jgi:hypothetical protein
VGYAKFLFHKHNIKNYSDVLTMSPAKQRSKNETQTEISDIMLGIPTPQDVLHEYGVLVKQMKWNEMKYLAG